MRPVVRAAFVDFTAPLEGVVRHFYLDVKGLVTIGIGNLVDPMQSALGLPMYKPDGTLATREEIGIEWQRIKADPNAARMGHRYAARLTALRMRDDDVTELVLRKLDANDAELRKRFPLFEEWAADAQLATLSMAWAMGPAFADPGPYRFPRLGAALRAGDFMLAATECRMNEEGNPGLAPRNKANRVLYTNAALSPDPSRLFWPRDLATDGVDTLPAPDDEVPTVPRLADFDVVHPAVPMGRPWEEKPEDPAGGES